jgi:HEAT repeat protein
MLTCRTVSFDRHQSVCHDLPAFILAGLEDKQRDAFIQAYPKNHPQRYDAGKLIEQLNRQPAMHPLAANPLLLSILCFVVDDPQSQVDLPATRGELYNQAVTKLMNRFEGNKRVGVRFPGEAPDSDEKRVILERVALELFAQNNQRSLTFTGIELSRALKVTLGEQGYGDASAPWANALRNDLTSNSGLLRRDLEKGYFFLHLTIQEFLAASCLARLVNEGQSWETTIELAGKRRTVREWVDKKTWDVRWQEVICLLPGRLADPGVLLDMLFQPKPTPTNRYGDDFYRHRLALAAMCIPEIPPTKRGIESDRIEAISTKILSIFFSRSPSNLAPVPFLIRALPSLAIVNGRVHVNFRPSSWIPVSLLGCFRPRRREPILSHLMELLSDAAWPVQQVAAEIVGGMGAAAATEGVLNQLATLLGDSKMTARCAAAEAVGGLGVDAATGPILDGLTRLLSDRNRHGRSAAARAVGRLGSVAVTAPILEQLLDRLSDPDREVQRAAAEAVGLLGPAAATDAIVDRLSDLLSNPVTEYKFQQVLSQDSFSMTVQTREEGSVLYNVVKAIERLGAAAAKPAFVDRLATLLRHPVLRVRCAAVKAVGGMGRAAATEGVLTELSVLLASDDFRVAQAGAEVLCRLEAREAIEPFLDRLPTLLTDPDLKVQRAAAEAACGLGSFAATNAFLEHVAMLLSNRSWRVRCAAATAAGGLGSAAVTGAILDHVAILLSDRDPNVRQCAVEAVGRLGPKVASEPILRQLRDLLSDRNNHVMAAAAAAVASLGVEAATEEVIIRLVDLVNYPGAWLDEMGFYGIAKARHTARETASLLMRQRRFFIFKRGWRMITRTVAELTS